MAVKKKCNFAPSVRFLFITAIAAAIFNILFFNPIFGVFNENAFGSPDGNCRGVYASKPIIYALYLKVQNRPVDENDIKTYIKIVSPSRYMHDRYNPFLWHQLYLKDEAKFKKLMDFVNSVKYFKENINAYVGGYDFKKQGFYLMYDMSDDIIQNGMKTRRNINFIKFRHGNIYYLFYKLTIIHENAGAFNFLKIPEKNAENFLNERTGLFGHIEKSVFLEYYFTPLKAKNNVLTVKAFCVKVYDSKNNNVLIGTIK